MILLQNITTATTGAPAPAPGPAPQGAPQWMTFLPLLVMLPFLFLTFRRQKKEDEARAQIKKGDKVVVGGVVGELVEQGGQLSKVKVASGVVLTIVTASMSAFAEKAAEDPLKDLKSAKDAKADEKAKDEKAEKAAEKK